MYRIIKKVSYNYCYNEKIRFFLEERKRFLFFKYWTKHKITILIPLTFYSETEVFEYLKRKKEANPRTKIVRTIY